MFTITHSTSLSICDLSSLEITRKPKDIVMKTIGLAPIEVESPELKKLIFLAIKQRPTEARFMA